MEGALRKGELPIMAWRLMGHVLGFSSGLATVVCFSLMFGVNLAELEVWQAGGLGCLCVIVMATVHGTFRWWTARYRREHAKF